MRLLVRIFVEIFARLSPEERILHGSTHKVPMTTCLAYAQPLSI